jgi:hypothetical protein
MRLYVVSEHCILGTGELKIRANKSLGRARTRFVLKGGLGNQFFIIAAADAYAKVTENEFELDFTLVNQNRSSHGNSLEKYLPEGVNVRSGLPRFTASKLEGFSRLLSPHSTHFSSRTLGFDESILRPGRRYRSIDGYFQSFKYMDMGSGLPNEIFQNIQSESSWGLQQGREFSEMKALVIHIRRGDYLQNKGEFGLLDWVSVLNAQLTNTLERFENIFLFGDDPVFIKTLARLVGKGVRAVIPPASASDFDVFVAMTFGKGIILSNSSFSFWAARLGQQKEVWYPAPWFQKLDGPNDLAPATWNPYKSEWER